MLSASRMARGTVCGLPGQGVYAGWMMALRIQGTAPAPWHPNPSYAPSSPPPTCPSVRALQTILGLGPCLGQAGSSLGVGHVLSGPYPVLIWHLPASSWGVF